MKLLQNLNITTDWDADAYREISVYETESEDEWWEFEDCMDNLSMEDVLKEWFGLVSEYTVNPGAKYTQYSVRRLGHCAMITKVVRYNVQEDKMFDPNAPMTTYVVCDKIIDYALIYGELISFAAWKKKYQE